jgi:uncharacterized protein (TIGR00297 family)
MGEEMQGAEEDTRWRKAIPEGRDRVQSRVLVGVVGTLLALESSSEFWWMYVTRSDHGRENAEILGISIVFALIVLGLRAATPAAAAFGGMICLVLLSGTFSLNSSAVRSGLLPLITLFVLTFLSTRAGRKRKARVGLAESRRGRNAAQVIANLSAAALCTSRFGEILILRGQVCCGQNFYSRWVFPTMMVMCLAALVEATADTVSSEIGQAFGGTPRLVLGFRRVEPGTDGAVTLIGTVAGVLGGAIVAAVGMWGLRLSFIQAAIAFGAGVCGLFFDSLVGATVERKGWIGNDLVNFTSTLFAAAAAALFYRMIVFTGWNF